MSTAHDTPNVGFRLWNISKRVSWVRQVAKEAATIVDEAAAAGHPLVGEMRALLEGIEDAARRAEEHWEQILSEVDARDPTLIDRSEPRVAVIGNHGPNPGLLKAIGEARSDRSWDPDAARLFDELEHMVGSK